MQFSGKFRPSFKMTTNHKPLDIHKEIIKGAQQFFNFELSNAKKTFDKQSARLESLNSIFINSSHTRLKLHNAEIDIIKALISADSYELEVAFRALKYVENTANEERKVFFDKIR